MDFAALDLPEPVMRGIREAGFVTATPIQEGVLPLALRGKDVAGQSQTGTGKTAAFLIAAFTRLLRSPAPQAPGGAGAPRVLIIAPTRELVVQIESDARLLGQFTPFRTLAVYGGIDYAKQREALAAGCDLLVGTPGRLIDYLKQRVWSPKHVEVLVIDEADRMFDMGFIADLRFILRRLPPHEKRQSFLFSATLSFRVLELTWEFMNNPTQITIMPQQKTVERVEQMLFHVGEHLLDALDCLLLRHDRDLRRVVHELPGELEHPERERRREEERLALLVRRQAAKDEPEVGDEPHVEHPVGLVDHEDLDMLGRPDALLEVVHEPAGRADEEVAAGGERLALLRVVDATVHREGAERGELAEEPRNRLDLDDQLACRRDDEHAWRAGAARRLRRRRAQEARERRDEEGRRLARARLRLPRDVLAAERQREHAFLDRCRGHEARLADSPHDGLGQVEGGEVHLRGFGGRGLRRGRRLPPEDARADDPDLVEEHERPGHERLVEGVGCRREHRTGDERAEDRVLPVLRERLRAHDADARQDRERERQLEHGAEGQRELQQEVGEVLERDHRLEARTRIAQQELERVGRHDEERERPAADEEKRPDDHEGQRVLLLVRVQPGRDERPDLPEDGGRRDEHADDEPHLHLDPQRLRRRREDERVIERRHGARQPVDDLLAEVQPGYAAGEERVKAPHDADAQLAQVLHE